MFDESDALGTLGDIYHVTRGYLKPYPCCRWAQPGVEAVFALTDEYDIDPDQVNAIHVATFEEATHLQTRQPESPEAAQYSSHYPITAALARGRFTQVEHTTATRTDAEIRSLEERVNLVVNDELDDHFPNECLARVKIEPPRRQTRRR